MPSKNRAHKIVTVSVLPPEIVQYYNWKLLDNCDMWKALLKKLMFMRDEAVKKYQAGSRKMRYFEQVMAAGWKLYEWQKAQKAYNKAEKTEAMERPAIPIESILSLRGQLGKDLRDAFCLQGASPCR